MEDWSAEYLRRWFSAYDCIESTLESSRCTASLDVMVVLSEDPRQYGYRRCTAAVYAPHQKPSFRAYRLDTARVFTIQGCEGSYFQFPWEQGVNIVIRGSESTLGKAFKALKKAPPDDYRLIGEIKEGDHGSLRLYYADSNRSPLTVHFQKSQGELSKPKPTSRSSRPPTYPYWLAGQPHQPNTDLEVVDKYSGEVAARVALADAAAIDAAIAAAVAAERPMRELPAYRRQAVLEHCVARFRERSDELAEALCIEAGKPIRDARGEVGRLIDTFKVAAEESVRIDGQTLELAISERARGYRGFTRQMPIGACSFIAPFNFPLNLVAHKVAPAIAAGCPFVLKPASRTPIGALIIGEILAETDLPPGAFSILPAHRDGADLFTTDERFKLLSFTGSPKVGWDLKVRAGRKKVVLELGGNAACIVDADQRDQLDFVVERLIFGAFYQSGQSCIGVQRILVHADLYETLAARFVAATERLVTGDPREETTFVGPMIDVAEAERLQQWIEEAAAGGARLLCGGRRDGAMLEATVLEHVDPSARISRLEAFGPVALLQPYRDFEEALAIVNDSDYGLQAGVFTHDLRKAMRAWDVLEVGGVIVGDVPSFRVDNMPYGGVKQSGLGREGVRYAIADMTETRLLVLRDPPHPA